MKTLSTKQETRLEKKKKKISALAELIKMNDEDRKIKKPHPSSETPSNSDEAELKLDVICGNSIEMLENNVCDEPGRKKIKLDPVGDASIDLREPAVTEVSKSIKNVIGKNHMENQNSEMNLSEIQSADINLTQEQYIQLKRELNERKRSLRNVTKLRLRELGQLALLSTDAESRTPIFLTDIQNLLMKALIGNCSPCSPDRWCSLEKPSRLSHSVVLVIEGLSLYHYLSYESKFIETNRIFNEKFEIVMPSFENGKIIQELAAIPLTSTQKDELINKYGSLEAAIELNRDPMLMVKTVFPIGNEEKCQDEQSNLANDDKFPRTQLLLSVLQMVDENYPLPLRGELSKRYNNYVLTKREYKEVTPSSPLFGLDCEMCRTSLGINELTRISIVNESLECIYETLVRPHNKIIDYLTQYSGITPDMMMNVTKTLKEVQKDVIQILPSDAILVGQSLNADLHAMKMMHPYCIDTSIIFNITGQRKHKSKLQTLVREFLGEVIQMKTGGHDSVEDSRASLKLAKLKLSKGVDFGDAILCGRKKANENNLQSEKPKIANDIKIEVANNLFAHVSTNERQTAIVASHEINVDFYKIFKSKANIYHSTILSSDKNSKENDISKNEHSNIDCYIMNSNKASFRKASDISNEYPLIITNVNIAPQRLELLRIEKTISNIDKNINKLWVNVAPNGLFIVLLGGAPGASHGVAMVKLKNVS